MSINSVNQSAASAYVTQQTSANTPAKNETTQPQNRIIEDVVELTDAAKSFLAEGDNAENYHFMGKLDLSNIPQMSDENLKINFDGYSSLDELIKATFGFNSVEEWRTDVAARGEYGTAKGEFDSANHKKSQAAYEAFLELSGGLLYGVSYEPDDLSKPIRTTDGRIHPKSDAIRNFLTEHKAEFDQVQQMINRQFMSFENWKANRAA